MARLINRDFGGSLRGLVTTTNKVDCGATDFIGTGAITMTGWFNVNPSSIAAAGRVFDNGKTIWNIAGSASVPTFRFRSDGAANVNSGRIPLGRWFFGSVTRDSSGTCNFYVNAALSGTANQASGTPAAGTTNVLIGNQNANGNEFVGQMTNLRIFNRVLTTAELSSLYVLGILPTDVLTSQVAFYPFDEGGGTTATDRSGNGRNGTVSGYTFSTQDVPMRKRINVREFGTALNFSASGDKVDCGTDFIGTGDVTITAWIAPRSIGATNGAILNNGILGFGLSTSNALRFTSDNATFIISQAQSLAFDGKWKFVAVTRTGTSVNFYVNGLPSGTPNQSGGTPAAASTNLTLGNNSVGTRNFDGFIDALRIFNRVLTPAEISEMLSRGMVHGGALATNLAASYNFNEGSGTSAGDSSGNSRNGTITGATFVTSVAMVARSSVSSRIRNLDFGTAYNFDGASTTIIVPHNANQLVTSGFTLSAWYKARSVGETAGNIIDKSTGNAAQGGYVMRVLSTNQIGVIVNNGTEVKSASNSVLFNDAKWHSVIASVDSSAVVSIYIDGVLSGTPASTGALSGITTTNALTFGNRSGATDRTFDGFLDMFRIWSRNLSAAEVSRVYLDGARRGSEVAQGIIGDWLLDEGSGTTALDIVGSNNGAITAGNGGYTTDVPMLARQTA